MFLNLNVNTKEADKMKNYTSHCDQQNVAYYICNECYDVVKVAYQNSFTIINGPDLENDISKTIYFKEPSLEVRCTKCDNFMFKCDINLVDIIVKLNKLQFFTVNCCEGHFNLNTPINFRISNPYIMFDTSLSQYDIELITICLNDAIAKYMAKLSESIDHKELFNLLCEEKIEIVYMYQNIIRVNEKIYDILWRDYSLTNAKNIFNSIKKAFVEICMTMAMYLEEKVSET